MFEEIRPRERGADARRGEEEESVREAGRAWHIADEGGQSLVEGRAHLRVERRLKVARRDVAFAPVVEPFVRGVVARARRDDDVVVRRVRNERRGEEIEPVEV